MNVKIILKKQATAVRIDKPVSVADTVQGVFRGAQHLEGDSWFFNLGSAT